MKKNFEYGILESVVVKDETIKGFLLNFNPRVVTTLAQCAIADLNKVSIDILLKRAGKREPIIIFTGYLHDLILGMYAQSSKYDMLRTGTTRGYLMNISFGDSVVALRGADELEVRIKADPLAFTDLNKADSTLTFETMPAIGNSPTVPQVKYYHIGNGEQQISMDLGDRINKIVCATDFTDTYDNSAKAALVDGNLTANGGFEKDFTEEQLYSENREMLRVNPETAVEDLVIYWSPVALSNVKLRAKLDIAADKDAKVITLGTVSAH